MINQTWRQGVQLKVAHPITAHHHCSILLIEGIYDLLQRFGRGIEVVRIQLYGKSSATVVIDGHIPTAANAKVAALRDDMDQSFVVHTIEKLRRLVSRVIIHHNDIKIEVSLLAKSTIDGIHDGLLAVVDRYHHRSLNVKVLLVQVRTPIERGINLCPNLCQVGRGGMLHFNLHLAVAGVHIIELLHPRGPQIGLFFRIEALVNMKQLSLTA